MFYFCLHFFVLFLDVGFNDCCRVVFLGNYSQSQQESAYKKASAIIDAGIGLVVVGTIFGFGIFSYVVYNYHFKQDRPNMNVK